MKKSTISILIKLQGKQIIPMSRLNQSLAGLIPLALSPNAVTTTTNAHLVSNKLRLLTLSGLILSSLTFSTAGYAALSTTTANTIKGTPPALSFSAGVIANDLDELVSLTMPDPAGGATPVDITPTLYPTTTPINAKVGVKFSDFTTKVTANNTALTLPAAYFYDADGDTPDPIAPVGGTLKATWTYQLAGVTKTVTAGELGDVLEACNAPYTLTLDANNVSAKSEYGDPNLNNYGSKTHTYTVNVNDYRFCYAKPANMNVFDGVNNPWGAVCSAGQCDYASGYNPDVFVPALGFIPKGARASAAANGIANFPTSGFDGAIFTLVMSNNQSDYTYGSNNGLAVVNTNGEVTLNNGGNALVGNQTVTITATPNDANFPAQTYQFTVLASQWARVPAQPLGGVQYNTVNDFTGTYPAAELCGAPTTAATGQLIGKVNHYGVAKASSYFFSRIDFTKSPIAQDGYYFNVNAGVGVPAGGTGKVAGFFSRDINGTFNDEWGTLNDGMGTDYPLSGFGAARDIWTAEADDSKRQFLVHGHAGNVFVDFSNYTFLAVCR